MFHSISYHKFLSTLFLISIFIVQLSDVQAQEIIIDQKSQAKPQLQHATKYYENAVITDYWVSEKLDGVRGYWTGEKLLTRKGNNLNPPAWFIEHWPKMAMGGELWSDRGQFEQISACVRRKKSNGSCWKKLKLMLFDLPHQPGDFNHRISLMKQVVKNSNSTHLAMVEQKKVVSNTDLLVWLTEVVEDKGEGLMLHLTTAKYNIGRSKNLLKLKKYQDAEAVVIAHMPGKGKYNGLLGAIKVKTPEGIIFKIGSGFTDLQREHPPKIGSVITYKYIGKTQRGVPRFASFLRIRNTH